LVRSLILGAGLALAAAAAHAQTPAYVGTWASKPEQCKLGQDDENGPMIMRRDGYDQHETHCKFTSVRKQGKGWAVAESCDVQGDTQKLNVTLEVAGESLTMSDKGGA